MAWEQRKAKQSPAKQNSCAHFSRKNKFSGIGKFGFHLLEMALDLPSFPILRQLTADDSKNIRTTRLKDEIIPKL